MVKALILRGPGTNCDMETVYAFKLAGAEVKSIFIDNLFRSLVYINYYHTVRDVLNLG